MSAKMHSPKQTPARMKKVCNNLNKILTPKHNQFVKIPRPIPPTVVPAEGYDTADEQIESSSSEYHALRSEKKMPITEEANIKKVLEMSMSNALNVVRARTCASTRVAGLHDFHLVLQMYYMPHYIEHRKDLLFDLVKKWLRFPKCVEHEIGIQMTPILALQTDGDNSVFETFNPLLLSRVTNPSTASNTRALCCIALALLKFLENGALTEVLKTMQVYERIFADSYTWGYGRSMATAALITPDAAELHTKAITSWALLCTILPAAEFSSWITSHRSFLPSVQSMISLMQSPHVQVRVAAAETMALIVEIGKSERQDFFTEYRDELLWQVRDLIGKAERHISKHNRNLQRVSLRLVLDFLENDMTSDVKVKVGKERLSLNTWSRQFQYAALCSFLGDGVVTHLKDNNYLRALFGLRPLEENYEPIEPKYKSKVKNSRKDTKALKALNKRSNAAAKKQRTVERVNNRKDKEKSRKLYD